MRYAVYLPDRVSGLLDSSGLRLYHTQTLRQHDIGVPAPSFQRA